MILHDLEMAPLPEVVEASTPVGTTEVSGPGAADPPWVLVAVPTELPVETSLSDPELLPFVTAPLLPRPIRW